MAHYLLDTNHASPLVTLDHPLRAKILERRKQEDTFSLCVTVVAETKYGIGVAPKAQYNLEEWQDLKSILDTYSLEEDDAELAADLRISLRKTGWQLSLSDALIAAVALRYDLILLTTDKDFSEVEGLTTKNRLAEL